MTPPSSKTPGNKLTLLAAPAANECDSACECGPSRRTALKTLGLAAATALSPRMASLAMAGPFEREDFDRLVPADKKLSPEWIKSLFERGAEAVYRGVDLQYIGMPVGGIGAGQLYLAGDGRLWHWDIFNQTKGTGAGHYAGPVKSESAVEQGFAITLAKGPTAPRRLDRTGFPAVTFRGQYPIGTVSYADPAFPISATLEAFSPFIPLSTDDSSLPATVLRFTLANTSAEAVEGMIHGWLQNAVLLDKPAPGATRRNRIVAGKGMTYLDCALHREETPASQPTRPDAVFEDWNKENYEGWQVEGTAFGSRPARRSQAPAYMGDLGGVGERLVNSHISAAGDDVAARDGKVGKLTSRPFTIDRRYIHLWVGGGNHPGKTCVNLRVNGKVAQSIAGLGDNHMSLRSFDVGALQGKEATLEIVDDVAGPWGNIGVGRISFSDQPAERSPLDAEPGFGAMGLALIGASAEHASCNGGRAGAIGKPGLDASASMSELLLGEIGRKFSLEPGKSVTVDFVLTWRFPNLMVKGLASAGRYYATRFDSAQAVAQYVCDHFDRLTGQTKLWRDTWYDSTLPFWFLDRTLLNASILATGTCMRFSDGRFYAWEGVGCCAGTCTHVWHYAHAAARLFPDIERDTRERVDLGVGFNPATGVMGFRAEFDRALAVDGQAGTLLRIYREHQVSPDDAFLKRNWTKIKKACEPLLKLDGNDDGVLEGAQMNTLDAPWYGKIAWLSSMYLAAIAAAGEMAREMGDVEFAGRCKQIAARGSENLVEQLFDGEYFYNRIDPGKLDTINSGTGCEIDQVLGQSWSWQVHLGRILPREQTQTALRSLWKYNFAPNVGPYRQVYKQGRWYAMPGEAGLLMATFPRAGWDYSNAKGKGADWAAGYFNECMNGFEHQAAGHMIWEGLVQEGLAVERAIHDRYHPSRRNPWNEIECGDHYSRSMASYGVYLAACGYEYHGPRGYLAFAPRLNPENFRAAFTAAEGWGRFAQQAADRSFTAQIDLLWGRLRLRELAFTLGEKCAPKTLAVRVNGQELPATFSIDGTRVKITLAAELTVETNQKVDITLR